MALNDLIRSLKSGDKLITPRLHQWLMQNDTFAVSEQVADIIRDELVAMGNGKRSGGFHPSGLGGCLRAHMFVYLGAPRRKMTDSQTQNLFFDGTWRHLRWQAMLLMAGIVTDIEVRIRMKRFRITGSMDAENKDENWGFELKGVRSISKPLREGPYPEHRKQMAGYFLARPDLPKFSLVYEDKAGQDWMEHVLTREDLASEIREAEAELVELNMYRQKRKLPPVLVQCKRGKGATFRACPYRDICLGATWPNKKEQ